KKNKENDSKEEKSTDKKEDKKKSSDKETENDSNKSDESANSEKAELPDGVEVITMPRLSDTMTEGTVAQWLKKEGDKVEEGDILAEIETDKATMEFESFYEGTLLKIGIQEGETAKVDTLLAIIGPEGTDVSGIDGKTKSTADTKGKEKTTSEEKSTSEDKASDQEKEEKTVQAKDGARIFASPLAKRMAEDKGIDLNDVKGSGEDGRIVKKDIESYKPSEKTAPSDSKEQRAEAPAVKPYVPAGEEQFEDIKNSQMRKTIARRLGESKFTAPHYYLTIEVNMETAMASRKQINDLPD